MFNYQRVQQTHGPSLIQGNDTYKERSTKGCVTAEQNQQRSVNTAKYIPLSSPWKTAASVRKRTAQHWAGLLKFTRPWDRIQLAKKPGLVHHLYKEIDGNARHFIDPNGHFGWFPPVMMRQWISSDILLIRGFKQKIYRKPRQVPSNIGFS